MCFKANKFKALKKVKGAQLIWGAAYACCEFCVIAKTDAYVCTLHIHRLPYQKIVHFRTICSFFSPISVITQKTNLKALAQSTAMDDVIINSLIRKCDEWNWLVVKIGSFECSDVDAMWPFWLNLIYYLRNSNNMMGFIFQLSLTSLHRIHLLLLSSVLLNCIFIRWTFTYYHA